MLKKLVLRALPPVLLTSLTFSSCVVHDHDRGPRGPRGPRGYRGPGRGPGPGY